MGADSFTVARAGFEPTQSEPKSEVLPLDDRAMVGKNNKLNEIISFLNVLIEDSNFEF